MDDRAFEGANRHQIACRKHCERRAAEREIGTGVGYLDRLEDKIRAMGPAFRMTGKKRFRMKVRTGHSGLIIAVFDTRLDCLVTVWREISANTWRKL